MTTFKYIIRREFAKAIRHGIQTVGIELCSDDEIIVATFKGHRFECNCDSDTQFVFHCKTRNAVVFPIPRDYYKLAQEN